MTKRISSYYTFEIAITDASRAKEFRRERADLPSELEISTCTTTSVLGTAINRDLKLATGDVRKSSAVAVKIYTFLGARLAANCCATPLKTAGVVYRAGRRPNRPSSRPSTKNFAACKTCNVHDVFLGVVIPSL